MAEQSITLQVTLTGSNLNLTEAFTWLQQATQLAILVNQLNNISTVTKAEVDFRPPLPVVT